MVTEISKGRDSTVPVFVGLSTDNKPTDVDNGSEFREFDTGKLYYFDAEYVEWCEQPGEGGGGGGGDFEVVTLTLINNSADKYLGINRLVWVYDDALETEGFPVEADETVEVQVVLYKGKAVMYPDPVDDTIDPIVTGDITFNSDEWYFEITGAGSIALTGTGEII